MNFPRKEIAVKPEQKSGKSVDEQVKEDAVKQRVDKGVAEQ